MDSDKIATIGCPACGRPNAPTKRACMYCGAPLPTSEAIYSPLTPEPPPPPPSPLSGLALVCPRCEGVALVEGDLSGLTIHRCEACLGVMMDGNTFDYLIRRQLHVVSQRELAGESRSTGFVERGILDATINYVKCPVCLRQMTRKNYAKCSGVMYDVCYDHGVWLDDHELQQLLAFVATGGLEMAEQFERAAEEDLKRMRARAEEVRKDAARYGECGGFDC